MFKYQIKNLVLLCLRFRYLVQTWTADNQIRHSLKSEDAFAVPFCLFSNDPLFFVCWSTNTHTHTRISQENASTLIFGTSISISRIFKHFIIHSFILSLSLSLFRSFLRRQSFFLSVCLSVTICPSSCLCPSLVHITETCGTRYAFIRPPNIRQHDQQHNYIRYMIGVYIYKESHFLLGLLHIIHEHTKVT